MTLSIQIVQVPPAEVVAKREFYITDNKVVIGRDFYADINLPDVSEQMSRSHILLEQKDGDGYTITDTSSNGTNLNDAKMISGTVTDLSDGDIIAFAGYKLLIGIIAERVEPAAEKDQPVFDVETDFITETPIVPDAEIEDIAPEHEWGFSEGGLDLEPDLMFDPFADGPEMNEEIETLDPEAEAPQKPVEFSNIVQIPARIAGGQTLPDLIDSSRQAAHYREKVLKAAEVALEKFLDEVDPQILQSDYDKYLPRFGRRQSRYWQIHLKQFVKRKSNGNFRRSFIALLTEELRKL